MKYLLTLHREREGGLICQDYNLDLSEKDKKVWKY